MTARTFASIAARLALLAGLGAASACQGYDVEPPCGSGAVRVCTCYFAPGLLPGERENGTTCALGCNGQGDCPPVGTQFCYAGQLSGRWSPCDCEARDPRATECPEGTVRADVHRCVPRLPAERCL